MKAQEFNDYHNRFSSRNYPRKKNRNLEDENTNQFNTKKIRQEANNNNFNKKTIDNPKFNHIEKGSESQFNRPQKKKNKNNIYDRNKLIENRFEERNYRHFDNNFFLQNVRKDNLYRDTIEDYGKNINKTPETGPFKYEDKYSTSSKSSFNADFSNSTVKPETDLIWGRHSAQAALESQRPIHRVWCTSELKSSNRFFQFLKKIKTSNILVEEVTWSRLNQLTGGAIHQGIVLQIAAIKSFDLNNLIERCSKLKEQPLLIAVEGLTDPHNLGAIIRSAEAFGAHGLVLPQRRSAGLTGVVAKVAAGALEHLPVARIINLNRSLDMLKDKGYTIIGLAEEGDTNLLEADLSGPLVIVTGSEGEGLSLLTRRHCDQLIRIPLRGYTPSLNASVASAVILYEIARRGWMQGLKGQSSPA